MAEQMPDYHWRTQGEEEMILQRLFSRMKLFHKLFWAITALNILTITAFTSYNYVNQKKSVMRGIDDKLLASAQGLKLSMERFHEKVARPETITPTEYRRELDSLSAMVNESGIKYAYTVMMKNGAVVFTLSSYTKEELEKGELTSLFEPYSDAAAGLRKALASGTIVYDQYTDQWGSVRSVFLPSRLPNGVFYAIGIDIGIDEIDLALRKTLLGCVGIGFCVFAAGSGVALLVAWYISRRIGEIAAHLNRIADGDLGVLVAKTSDDEIGMLADDMNRMVKKLTELLRSVRDASHSVVTASSHLHATSAQMSTGVDQVAAQAIAVATAAEEMAATSQEIARNCDTAAHSVRETEGVAQTAEGVVKHTVEMMNSIALLVNRTAATVKELGASSDQIGNIIATIDEIADQTNLLALNAAIEAARAGEQGRGFAVVADEVRALAERTSRATREISGMIQSIQQNIGGAVDSMEEGVTQVAKGTTDAARSGDALQAILRHAQAITAQVNQVAMAAAEQTTTTSEISDSINRITSVAKETVQDVQSSTAAAGQLISLADELKRQVEQFQLSP
jgi:methyl-accepting chemotaxis protein